MWEILVATKQFERQQNSRNISAQYSIRCDNWSLLSYSCWRIISKHLQDTFILLFIHISSKQSEVSRKPTVIISSYYLQSKLLPLDFPRYIDWITYIQSHHFVYFMIPPITTLMKWFVNLLATDRKSKVIIHIERIIKTNVTVAASLEGPLRYRTDIRRRWGWWSIL